MMVFLEPVQVPETYTESVSLVHISHYDRNKGEK